MKADNVVDNSPAVILSFFDTVRRLGLFRTQGLLHRRGSIIAMDMVTRVLAAIGAVTMASFAYRICSFFYPFIRPSRLSRYKTTSDGSPPWAVITGSSDGIGKALADELASQGFNIVLHGRNPAKLSAVKQTLQASHPAREFRVITADASALSAVDFDAIAGALSDVRVKILVNNVGAHMPAHHEVDTLETYTAAELEANVAVNATFSLLMTRALLPNLIANQPSAVLYNGSINEGMPCFPAIGPSNAFKGAASYELRLEQRFTGRDIEVMTWRIMGVSQTGSIASPADFFSPDPKTWAKAAVRSIGCGKAKLFPYFPHAVLALMLGNLPEWMAVKVWGPVVEDFRKDKGDIFTSRREKKSK